jgi:hypothetical protein
VNDDRVRDHHCCDGCTDENEDHGYTWGFELPAARSIAGVWASAPLRSRFSRSFSKLAERGELADELVQHAALLGGDENLDAEDRDGDRQRDLGIGIE